MAGYRPPFVHSERALEAPWTRVIVMSVTVDESHQGEKSEWKPSESEYVGWAVALHRFLVKQWGVDPAPSLVGKYVSGIKRPANNVAIQILDSELKSSYGIQLRDDVARKLPGFLIMLPKDMPQHDMQKLYDVCKRSKGKTLYFSHIRIFDCRRVSRVNMIDYAHHTNSSNVLRAMSALIAISDGEGSLDCAALAVGQSRHLGGGFLVPLDFPKNMIVPDGHFEKGVPSWLK